MAVVSSILIISSALVFASASFVLASAGVNKIDVIRTTNDKFTVLLFIILTTLFCG
jgi:hypothetical protein